MKKNSARKAESILDQLFPDIALSEKEESPMEMKTLLSCTFISVGAIIMLVAIIRSGNIQKLMDFVPNEKQRTVRMYLFLHRSLMVFFLLGYAASIAAIVLKYPLLSEIFVSLIFLFGAVFVYMGISLQSQLLSDIQHTIQGILPICVKCKKIRASDPAKNEPDEWVRIESYISKNTDVDFSHGYCPDCFGEEMTTIKNTE